MTVGIKEKICKNVTFNDGQLAFGLIFYCVGGIHGICLLELAGHIV